MELQERIERLERLIGGNGVDDENGKRLTGRKLSRGWMAVALASSSDSRTSYKQR